MTELTREEMLVVILEECGETIQAITKCLRFGWGRDYPGYGVNYEELAKELGDLMGMIDALPFDSYCWALLEKHRLNKYAKARKAKKELGSLIK